MTPYFLSLLSLLVATCLLIVTTAEEKRVVHAFYYLWYGTPDHDGSYKHWDHEVLPHWEDRTNERYRNIIGQRHKPPGKLHSPFYPEAGPYSSKDPAMISMHLEQMSAAGIDLAIISWWGRPDNPSSMDTQGVCTDYILIDVLSKIDSSNSTIKVGFHLEPYAGRTVSSVREGRFLMMSLSSSALSL